MSNPRNDKGFVRNLAGPLSEIKHEPHRGNYMQEKLPDFFLDTDKITHFLNMLPAYIQDEILHLPPKNFEMSEEELRIYSWGSQSFSPIESTSAKLRVSIWEEYDRCCRKKLDKLLMANVVHGICNINYFINKFIKDQQKLTWILYPPCDYQKNLKELLDCGLTEFMAIMRLPNSYKNKAGDDIANAKLLDVKLKIWQHVDLRLKGAIIQRIDQRNVNVNFDSTISQDQAERLAGELDKPATIEEIDRQIAELASRSKALGSPVGVIDIPQLVKPGAKQDAELVTEQFEVIDKGLPMTRRLENASTGKV